MSESSGRSICVFCGSQRGRRADYTEAARSLGHALAGHGTTLVYGGGSIGLMGVIADAVLEAGGRAIGVIPERLAKKEVMHEGLTELHVVASMHQRKRLMSDLSDAFIGMPGGFGTFEEILEAITWGQLGIQAKPVGLLNIEGYFDPLIRMVDQGISEGFIRPLYRSLFVSAPGVEALLERLWGFKPLPSILEEMGLEGA